MATIDNRTGAPHFWFEQTGPAGERIDVLVVRATFDFAGNGERMTVAQEQHPIVFGDTFAGPVASDPLRAVVVDDGDLLPYKPGTDVLISGHAQAPNGHAHTAWHAGVFVGNVKKVLRLHGPRQFQKGLFGWRLGQAQAVINVPLDYRLSYGGCIDIPGELTADGRLDAISHPGNPAGCGWLPNPADYKRLTKAARQYLAKWIGELEVLPVPQIELATEPVLSPYDGRVSQGLGVLARWWSPRATYQGKYDSHWGNTRFPLLPDDFDSRYYQGAPADQVCTPHLNGDETVTLAGLMPEKRFLRLPGWRLVAVAKRASGASTVVFPVLDTLRFDLDSAQSSLVWRAHFASDDPVVEIALAATTAAIESAQPPLIMHSQKKVAS